MKYKSVLNVVATATLVMCLATPALAQHCDVSQGDSMWKIAKRYRVDFQDVLDLNKHFKNQSLIHPTDEVELPNGSEGVNTDNHSKSDGIEEGSNQATEQGETQQAEEVLKLVNEERSKQGLKALTLNSDLTNVAMAKAKDMKDNNYFSHISPTYGTPFEMLQHFGLHYSFAGENIASGQKTAKQVMNDWMNSSGHRANILNKNYSELGVGFTEGGNYGTEWVQLFIKP